MCSSLRPCEQVRHRRPITVVKMLEMEYFIAVNTRNGRTEKAAVCSTDDFTCFPLLYFTRVE